MNTKLLDRLAVYAIGLISVLMIVLALNHTASALSCNNCVTGGDIVTGTIKASDLGSNSVGSSEVATSSIGSSELSSNSVGNSELVDDITLTTLTAQDIQVSGTLVASSIFNTDFLNLGSAVVTDIPDSGDIAAAEFTLDSAQAYAFLGLNCLDADGCNVTLAEDFNDGDVMHVYNAGTNTVNFADTSGVSELAGPFAMGEWDTLQLIFRQDDVSSGRWLETSRSDN